MKWFFNYNSELRSLSAFAMLNRYRSIAFAQPYFCKKLILNIELVFWTSCLFFSSLFGALITLKQIRGDQDSIFVHRHVTDQLESSMDAQWACRYATAYFIEDIVYGAFFIRSWLCSLPIPTAIFKASFRCIWCYDGLCSSCTSCLACHQANYFYDVENVSCWFSTHLSVLARIVLQSVCWTSYYLPSLHELRTDFRHSLKRCLLFIQ